MLDEAQAHEEAQRYAIAAERYLQLYDAMRDERLPRAAVALWSAGFCLSHVAGREQDALETLRRFLEASVPLAQELDIQGFRSESVSIISELEARAPTEARAPDAAEGQALGDPGSGLSPIGPILLGVGGAALLAGVIVAAVGLSEDQDLIARCPERVGCDESLRSEVEATRNLGLAGDALWIAGASVALLGLVLTFTLEAGDEESDHAELEIRGTLGGGFASLRWRIQ